MCVYQDLYNKSWKATDEAEKAERKAQQEISIAQRKAEVRVGVGVGVGVGGWMMRSEVMGCGVKVRVKSEGRLVWFKMQCGISSVVYVRT